MPIGTIVNVLAVLAGGSLGLLLHKNFPENIKKISFQGIGLCTLLIGMQMAFKVENILLLIISVLLGGISGELLRLHERFTQLGNWVKRRVKTKNEKFTDGLMTAFILFCVGSLAILGALDEGLRSDPTLLVTKSVLDGFSSIILASVYGNGVLFSAIPLFIFQAGITLVAGSLEPYLSATVVNQMAATGGILILGLGLNLLEITQIKITNLLPAIFIAAFLSLLAPFWPF